LLLKLADRRAAARAAHDLQSFDDGPDETG
jgi:hypothetical protein